MSYSNPIVAGDVLIREAIKSENYEQGVSGWAIFRNGDAEFNDVTARGDITASSITVPFTNTSGDHYTISIRPQTTDQPDIEFAFVGDTTPLWTPGVISVEAIDALGRGTTFIEPLQPASVGLGSPPGIQIDSHRPNGAAGRVVITGSTATGDQSADDRPTFEIFPSFGVDIPTLRPVSNELGSNSGREITSVGFTSNLDGDVLEVEIPPARSGCVMVGLFAQMSITSGAGFFTVEIEDEDGSTIISPTDGKSIITVNLAGARITYYRELPFFNASLATSRLTVRAVAKTSSGGTFTIQRAEVWAKVEP